VECKKLGISSVGLETNPMGCFASQVKTQWSIDPELMLRSATEIAEQSVVALKREGISDDPNPKNLKIPLSNLRRLPDQADRILLKDSISPLPLHKVLTLLTNIAQRNRNSTADHERLALAREIVYSFSNLRFGPEIGLGDRRDDAPVVSTWLTTVRQIASDIYLLVENAKTPSRVVGADSRRVSDFVELRSIDAVITSPPYPNEKDYTRTTRLESVILGFLASKADLRALKQSLIRSNTRNIYKGDSDDLLIGQNARIQKIAKEIEARRLELGKTSGFERLYAKVTKEYFGGMARHLATLRAVLRSGASLAYVVGDQASYLRVMIRTGELLAEIAESLGYEVLSIDLFRTRLATATREQLREEVVCLRWP
jgi:hypothetical protein